MCISNGVAKQNMIFGMLDQIAMVSELCQRGTVQVNVLPFSNGFAEQNNYVLVFHDSSQDASRLMKSHRIYQKHRFALQKHSFPILFRSVSNYVQAVSNCVRHSKQ